MQPNEYPIRYICKTIGATMKIKLLLSSIALLFFVSCESQIGTEGPTPPTPKNMTEILAELENAYNSDSVSLLSGILDEWSNEFSAKDVNALPDDVEKAIFIHGRNITGI